MYAKQKTDGVAISRTQLDNTWVEVTGDLPDKTYRNAWVLNGTSIEIDPIKQGEIDRVLFKQSRAEAVDNITVEVDGMVFDGDEVSQTRMARAIAASGPGDTTNWLLSDNTIAAVTHEQLKQALRLSGEAQTSLWFQG